MEDPRLNNKKSLLKITILKASGNYVFSVWNGVSIGGGGLVVEDDDNNNNVVDFFFFELWKISSNC